MVAVSRKGADQKGHKVPWSFIDKEEGEYNNSLHIMNTVSPNPNFMAIYELDLAPNPHLNRTGNRWEFRTNDPFEFEANQTPGYSSWARDYIIKAVIGAVIHDDGTHISREDVRCDPVLQCWIVVDVSKIISLLEEDERKSGPDRISPSELTPIEDGLAYKESMWASDESGDFQPIAQIINHPTSKARWIWMPKFGPRRR